MSKKHRMFQETPRKGKTTKLADTTPEFPYPELIQAIWAGESNSIIVVDSGPSDNEKVTKYCKQLTCYPDFHKCGKNISTDSGIVLPGIAIWKRPFALQIAQDVTVRYKILKFYYQQYLITYAIPVSKADSLTSLPQIECTPDEIKAILRAADVLSKPSLKEKPHRISSPVANDIAAHRDAFASHSTADLPARLLTLMQSDDYILALVAICADVHYRAMHSQPKLPDVLYNFVGESRQQGWRDQLLNLFTALNFSTSTDCTHTRPLITQVKDPNDLKRWHNGPRDRLHLISTATGSLLWSLIECLSDRENHSQCGRRSSPLHTVPITLCSSALCSPYAFDFDLTKNSKSIGPDDFDLIREAMCKFLQDQHLQTAKMLFDRRMSSPTSYRMIPRVMWFESLEQAFIDCIFGDHPAYNEACTLLANTTSAQLEQATLREESLARALELIAHPACFAKHLIPCPKTWEDALGALCNDAYAFHKRFQKGKHRGCQALAFTSDSLKRLLHTVSCNESLFDSFLERTAAQDLLLDRSEVLNIGGETRRVILFRLNDESLSLAEK